jgi:hypothetical protein
MDLRAGRWAAGGNSMGNLGVGGVSPADHLGRKNGPWPPEKRYQVLWIADKSEGDLVTITPKGPQEQDPENPARGLAITGLFENVYQIPGSSNAVSSGLPKLSTGPGSVLWRYDVEIRDAEGNVICRVDPEICIRGLGGGCIP